MTFKQTLRIDDMSFVSFAQNFDFVMLWRAFKDIDRGFYVDIGAWSATLNSVTRAFYEHGWRGINVEPNPHYYSELIRHRPRDVNLQQAVSDVTGKAEMYLVPDSGLSSLDEAVARDLKSLGWSVIAAEVELTTLAAIWASHVPAGQDVHFLKVDVEGAEEAVLRGNDWGRNRPWIVIVEVTKPSSRVDSYRLVGASSDFRQLYVCLRRRVKPFLCRGRAKASGRSVSLSSKCLRSSDSSARARS